MSVDYTVYVGPWFLCRTERVREPDATKWCCVNQACIAHGAPARAEVRFCSVCGQTLTGREVPGRERDAVDPDGVEETIGEDVLILVYRGSQRITTALPPGIHVWLPNLRLTASGRPLSFNLRRESEFRDLEGLDGAEVTWLLGQYRREYHLLRDAYGGDKVETGWGVLTYCS